MPARRSLLPDRRPALPVVRPLHVAIGALVIATVAGHAAPARAQNNRDRLKEVERRIDKGRGRDAALSRQARALARKVQKIRNSVLVVARRLQFQEAATMRVELRLAQLESNMRLDRAEYRRNERQFLRIVGALRRVQSNPPGVLAMHFSDAQDAIRSTVVLRSLIPQMRKRADELRKKVIAYNRRRHDVKQQRIDIAAKAAQLRRTRAELAALLGEQTRLLSHTQEEKAAVRRRLSRLTKRADTLQDLMSNLKQERIAARKRQHVTIRPKPKPRAAALTRPGKVRRFGRARGKVSTPVSGRILQAFNTKDQYGITLSGMRFEARDGAQVVAPYDGQIVFAGPFRSYGHILIIKHTDGYHSLVAGLARIDVVNRQWVLAGEPIGIVGAKNKQGARLYLELRKNGRPINPQPWLAADKRKVDG